MNLRVLCGLCLLFVPVFAEPSSAQDPTPYLGFDRNDYPGDASLQLLHRTFSYAGYWLNNPPGESTNGWDGKRQTLESVGFGFLVLFNGRLYKELKRNPAALGRSDGHTATAGTRREGFPLHTVIFLDIEEGGRMLPEQKAYIYAWIDAVTAAGFRAGVYCSGIPVVHLVLLRAELILPISGNLRNLPNALISRRPAITTTRTKIVTRQELIRPAISMWM